MVVFHPSPARARRFSKGLAARLLGKIRAKEKELKQPMRQ